MNLKGLVQLPNLNPSNFLIANLLSGFACGHLWSPKETLPVEEFLVARPYGQLMA